MTAEDKQLSEELARALWQPRNTPECVAWAYLGTSKCWNRARYDADASGRFLHCGKHRASAVIAAAKAQKEQSDAE